jgi:3-deoxy-D-manno-octulosonic-acid transferase
MHIFHFWHAHKWRRALFAALTSAFELIIPHSDIEVGRFRLMGATLAQMPGWCNDLSYACALSSPVANLWRPSERAVQDLQRHLNGRDAWLVCNALPSEEATLRATHLELRVEFSRLLTVYVPLDPTRGPEICHAFAATGVRAVCSTSLPPSCAPPPPILLAYHASVAAAVSKTDPRWHVP